MVIIIVISIINKLSILGRTYLRLSQMVETQILILLNMISFFSFFFLQHNKITLTSTELTVKVLIRVFRSDFSRLTGSLANLGPR